MENQKPEAYEPWRWIFYLVMSVIWLLTMYLNLSILRNPNSAVYYKLDLVSINTYVQGFLAIFAAAMALYTYKNRGKRKRKSKEELE